MRPVVSEAAEEFYASLGPWTDADESANWALLLFSEAVAGLLQPMLDVSRDQSDGTPGWAIIMDPATAPVDFLPWLGQFVGVEVDTYQTQAEQIAQIEAEQNTKRGTVAAIKARIQQFLQGTKTVNITERDTSPYHFAVQVYRGELAGLHYNTLDSMYLNYNAMDAAYLTYGDMTSTSEQDLTDAAIAAKPAGLVMQLTVTPGTP